MAGRVATGMEVLESGCGPAESGAQEPSPVPSKTTGHYELPWVEKYRPVKLNEIVGNKRTRSLMLRAHTHHGSLVSFLHSTPLQTAVQGNSPPPWCTSSLSEAKPIKHWLRWRGDTTE